VGETVGILGEVSCDGGDLPVQAEALRSAVDQAPDQEAVREVAAKVSTGGKAVAGVATAASGDAGRDSEELVAGDCRDVEVHEE